MTAGVEKQIDDIATSVPRRAFAWATQKLMGRVGRPLVNPFACHETELPVVPAANPREIAVVGAGHVGGQLHLAAAIPDKEEFRGLIDWFGAEIAASTVTLRLGETATADDLVDAEEIIIATGVKPRDPAIPEQELPHVVTYADLLSGGITAGGRIAVVGAGGIGFDVAGYLVTGASPTTDLAAWLEEWGVTDPAAIRGGVTDPRPAPPLGQVTLLQRKAEKPGRRLGKTTGWIHRVQLQMKGVRMLGRG